MQVLTGSTSDISILLYFVFWILSIFLVLNLDSPPNPQRILETLLVLGSIKKYIEKMISNHETWFGTKPRDYISPL
jgi:hypothetical protein